MIRALQGLVGGWHLRGFLHTALAFLLHRRLSEIVGLMERMAARFAAGRLWRCGPRAGGVSRAAADLGAGPVGRVARIWPGRFGWLVRLGSWQAAGYGSQLRAVLGQPEMVALLAVCPQARRTLRPLCRMLAIETSLLSPRAEAVEPGCVEPAERAGVAAVRGRVRATPAPVERPRIPLPRGVLSAVRRQGFGRER